MDLFTLVAKQPPLMFSYINAEAISTMWVQEEGPNLPFHCYHCLDENFHVPLKLQNAQKISTKATKQGKIAKH